ncbi:MAG: sterol desaturase family protein [Sphingobacteriales bacterium]|nr:MAG: sterol desaturase family protein [Sphingobacteriales bacterium]
MDIHNIKIIIAIPVFLILILLEYLAMRKKNPNYYRLNDAITNLNIGAGHVLSKIFIGALLLGVYNLVYSIRIINIPDGIFSYIFCIFAYDFFFYWAHRLGHEVNFFWGAHGVHHQSEDYNLSVALRQSWLHAAVAFFIFLPIHYKTTQQLESILGKYRILYRHVPII